MTWEQLLIRLKSAQYCLHYHNMGSKDSVRPICGLFIRCRKSHMCRWWKYVREVAKDGRASVLCP